MPLLGDRRTRLKKPKKVTRRKKTLHMVEEITSVAVWERTFESRKQTIMKKAKELELCCGVLVTVTIQTQSGLVHFYSSNSQITDILKSSGLLGSQSVDVATCMHNPTLNEIKNFKVNFNTAASRTHVPTMHAQHPPTVSTSRSTGNLKQQNVLSRMESRPAANTATTSATTKHVPTLTETFTSPSRGTTSVKNTGAAKPANVPKKSPSSITQSVAKKHQPPNCNRKTSPAKQDKNINEEIGLDSRTLHKKNVFHSESMSSGINIVLPEALSQRKNGSTIAKNTILISSSESESSSEDEEEIPRLEPRTSRNNKSPNIINSKKLNEKKFGKNSHSPSPDSSEESCSDESESEESSDCKSSSTSSSSSDSESSTSSSSSSSSLVSSDDDAIVCSKRNSTKLALKSDSSSENSAENPSQAPVCTTINSSSVISSTSNSLPESTETKEKAALPTHSDSTATSCSDAKECNMPDPRSLTTGSISPHTSASTSSMKSEAGFPLHGNSQCKSPEDNIVNERCSGNLLRAEAENNKSNCKTLFNDLKSKGNASKKRDNCNYVVLEDLQDTNKRRIKKTTRKPVAKLSRLPQFTVVKGCSEPVYVLENRVKASKKKRSKPLRRNAGSPKKTKQSTNIPESGDVNIDTKLHNTSVKIKSEDVISDAASLSKPNPENASRPGKNVMQVQANCGGLKPFVKRQRLDSQSTHYCVQQSFPSMFTTHGSCDLGADKEDKKPVAFVAESLVQHASVMSDQCLAKQSSNKMNDVSHSLSYQKQCRSPSDDTEELQAKKSEIPINDSSGLSSKNLPPAISKEAGSIPVCSDGNNSSLKKNSISSCVQNAIFDKRIFGKLKIENDFTAESQAHTLPTAKESQHMGEKVAENCTLPAFDGTVTKAHSERFFNANKVASDTIENETSNFNVPGQKVSPFNKAFRETLVGYIAPSGATDFVMNEKNVKFTPTSLSRHPVHCHITEFTEDDLPEQANFNSGYKLDKNMGQKRKLDSQQNTFAATKRRNLGEQNVNLTLADEQGDNTYCRPTDNDCKGTNSPEKAKFRTSTLPLENESKPEKVHEQNTTIIPTSPRKILKKKKSIPVKKAKVKTKKESMKVQEQNTNIKPTSPRKILKKKKSIPVNTAKVKTKKESITKNCKAKKAVKSKKLYENDQFHDYADSVQERTCGSRLPSSEHRPNVQMPSPIQHTTNIGNGIASRQSFKSCNNTHKPNFAGSGPSRSGDFQMNSSDMNKDFVSPNTNKSCWNKARSMPRNLDFFSKPERCWYTDLSTYCKLTFESAFSDEFLKRNPKFLEKVEGIERRFGFFTACHVIRYHLHFKMLKRHLYNAFSWEEMNRFCFDALVTSNMFRITKQPKDGKVLIYRRVSTRRSNRCWL